MPPELPHKTLLLSTLALFSLGIVAYISFDSIHPETLITKDKESQGFGASTATEQASKLIEDLSYTIHGTITSLSPNSITVTAPIVDESKLLSLDYSKPNTLETIEKTLTVGITKDTKMSEKPKVGDMVIIHTNESVYRSNTLTASTIEMDAPIPVDLP